MRTSGDRSSNTRSSGRIDQSAYNRAPKRRLSDSSGRSSSYSPSYQSSYRDSSGRRSSYDRDASRNRSSFDSQESGYYASRNRSYSHREPYESAFLSTSEHYAPQSSGFMKMASYAWENFRIPVLILLCVLAVALAILFAFVFNSGRYVKGTTIGDIDVSGMTVTEASAAINERYVPNVDATRLYVFADEKTRDSADLDLQLVEASAQAEQISFEEAKSKEKLWVASAKDLGAVLPAEEIAMQAKAISDDNGIFERIGILPSSVSYPVYLTYEGGYLEDFAQKINESMGTPVDDYSLEVKSGVVYIDKGHKGVLLNNEQFGNDVSELLLMDDSPTVSYVVNMSKVNYDINKKKANKAKRAIEKLLPESVSFNSSKSSKKVSKATLMSWIDTEKSQLGDEWILKVRFKSDLAAKELTASLNKAKDGKFTSISISGNGDDIKVSTSEMIDLYDLESGLSKLEEEIFGTYNTTGQIGDAPKDVAIELNVLSSSNEFSLEDALSHGIVTRFSSYTTRYANTASTANRMNNIHLAAKKLDKSIAKADGGVWSFNDVVGPATADEGYLEANVIDRNTMTTGVGGGICQVATTVFNAIYEAGLPIVERNNHTLYTSSYPAGRDAAIAYPYLDLKWKNDTESDILVVSSFTNDSVTVTLIGADPGRTVSTETGEWEKGAKYKTVYEVDDTLSKDASYIKQNGSDGTTISVTRTTKASDGSVLSTSTFPSSYAATDRVIAYGKKSDMDALKEKYEKKHKKKKAKAEETAEDSDNPEETEVENA